MENVEIRKKLFGKEVVFVIRNVDEYLAHELIEDIYIEGLRLQKLFNFYDDKSELSNLNIKRSLSVSNELIFVLKKALEMAKITNGLYDPTLGKNFVQRKTGKELTKLVCSYKDVSIDGSYVKLLNNDVLIDLGSIAKGYIADQLSNKMKESGIISGLVDARGDLVSFGDEDFEIKIQHPREKDKFVKNLKISNEGIATSGDYNQYYDNYDKSHIINKKNYISVTVIAPTLMEADLYATAIFVSDKKDVKRILKSNKEIKAFCIDKNLIMEEYNKFNKYYIK